MLQRWKKISETLISKNPYWRYQKDEYELPSGNRGEYFYVRSNGSSMIIPIRDDGKIILVKQYRYLNNRDSIEFVCGGVKDGHTYEETARSELAEEAGFKAAEWKYLGEFNPFNGASDEMCRVYLAKNLVSIDSKPDLTEEFEYLFLTIDEVDKLIESGEICD